MWFKMQLSDDGHHASMEEYIKRGGSNLNLETLQDPEHLEVTKEQIQNLGASQIQGERFDSDSWPMRIRYEDAPVPCEGRGLPHLRDELPAHHKDKSSINGVSHIGK